MIMKKYIYGLVILLSVISCSSSGVSGEYNISGSWANGEGEFIYLGFVDKDTRKFDAIDTAVVENGKYAMSGVLTDFSVAAIKTSYGQKNVFLCDEPFKVDLELKETAISKNKSIKRVNFSINDSREQELYNQFSDASMIGLMGVLAVGMNMEKAKADGDQALQDSLVHMYTVALQKERAIKDSLFSNFKNNYVAATVIDKAYLKEKTYEELSADFESLSAKVQSSLLGVRLKEKIALIKDVSKGAVAPNFELPNVAGENISLESFHGKYVLIDFWASWCAPCIKEMPNIKRLYEEYKDCGFEVLSVSLDDNKARWEKAIADNNLTWEQVSSLKGWGCSVAQRYNVKSVPKLCLVDKEGKILLDDVHGEDLESELVKIFSNK